MVRRGAIAQSALPQFYTTNQVRFAKPATANHRRCLVLYTDSPVTNHRQAMQ